MPQRFNRLLAQLNPDSQVNLMQVTELSAATAVLLAEKVARGEFVAIAGDRIPVTPKPRVAMAEFFGAPAPFPVGPYILASCCNARCFCSSACAAAALRKFTSSYFASRFICRAGSASARLPMLAAEYALRLEHYCRRAPLQWFNFYEFWRLPTMDPTNAPR